MYSNINQNSRLVSVIVPMYNVEAYVSKCIESILAQGNPNWELLLINDGSSDASLEIAKSYEKRDCRIKVYSQDNAGVSCARNKGIELASGQIIVFLDSDDWLESNCIETILLNWKEDTDIIVFDYYEAYANAERKYGCSIRRGEYYQAEEKGTLKDFFLLSLLGYYDKLLDRNVYRLGVPWGKAYAADLLKGRENFPQGVAYAEDVAFNIVTFHKAENIRYVSQPLYYYFINQFSVVHQMHKNIERVERSYSKLIDFIYSDMEEMLQNEEKFCGAWNKFLISRMKVLIYSVNRSSSTEASRIIERFCYKQAVYIKTQKFRGLSLGEIVITVLCYLKQIPLITKIMKLRG